MLRELAVQNLALIEDVRVELCAGFCAWTGETGAGKSLLLGALGLLLGERGSAELIRSGSEELRVTGRFEFVRPEQKAAAASVLGQETFDEPELIITRRLARTGRSTATVNEQPVAITTLKRLGEILVDVHGQRESYSLLQPGYQLEVLDSFGKLTEQRERYIKSADRVRELRRQHRELSAAKATRLRELALVRFERDELEQAALKATELADLQKERDRLINAQALAKFSGGVASRLYDDDGSVVETLGRLIKEATHWGNIDKRLAEVATRLTTLRPEVQDLADTCRDLSEQYEADPGRLDEIEHRLALLRKLESKYGKTIPNLIEYATTLQAKEDQFQAQEDNLSSIETDLKPAFAELKTIAEKLSTQRAKVAKKLAAEAQKHLADLQMAKAKLDAVLISTPLEDQFDSTDLPAFGMDQLEIMLAANPGEPSRPLRKVASGGELSRTMLALKTVLAAHDPVRTLVVFDEIDANVGGRLGDVLGQKLAALGATHQVLCVTHLPQVACYAQHQWTIRKQTSQKRTATTITPLNTDAARIEELAIMLRGESRSETTTKEAEEMLKHSRL